MEDTGVVTYGHSLHVADIGQAFGLSKKRTEQKLRELETYGLGCTIESDIGYCFRLRGSGQWRMAWMDLARHCRDNGENFETLWRDLDFSILDE